MHATAAFKLLINSSLSSSSSNRWCNFIGNTHKSLLSLHFNSFLRPSAISPFMASLANASLNTRAGVSQLPEWWSALTIANRRFAPLKGDAGQFDVVVLGGGIVGVTAAYLLKKAGKRVALIEARTIGTGTTGSSTAKLTSQQKLIYSVLAKMHGHDTARLYGQMNEEAISKVESLVSDLKLDCDFRRVAHYTYTCEEKQVDSIRQEVEESVACGLPAEFIEGSPIDLPSSIQAKAAVRFTNQAEFNPFKFCKQLADHVNGDGSLVFEDTRATAVNENSPHEVTLETGVVRAENVVLATHLPIMDRSMHFTFLSPSRTHCVAVRLKSPVLREMCMSADMPMRSLRVTEGGRVLIVAGESIKVGSETDTNKCYAALEDWARLHFPVESLQSRWSAMDYVSSDHLPWAGYLYRGTNTIYTATGFSKWGLTNGVASAMIIRDLVEQREDVNPYFKMVDARRWSLTKAGPGMLQEGLHTAQHFIGDKLKSMVAPDIDTLKAGTGGLVKVKGTTVGAFLDKEGNYHLVKPVCTHLGCHLLFNQGDSCWDCPCHGSQFTVDGQVIHGPACKNLEVLKDLEW